MRRVLIWIGWLTTLPGFVLSVAFGVTLAGLPQAAGCVQTRMFAVRCPETLAGNSLRDLYDLGMIMMLTLPVSALASALPLSLSLLPALLRVPSADEHAARTSRAPRLTHFLTHPLSPQVAPAARVSAT